MANLCSARQVPGQSPELSSVLLVALSPFRSYILNSLFCPHTFESIYVRVFFFNTISSIDKQRETAFIVLDK